jgi:hypothetical protein
MFYNGSTLACVEVDGHCVASREGGGCLQGEGDVLKGEVIVVCEAQAQVRLQLGHFSHTGEVSIGCLYPGAVL